MGRPATSATEAWKRRLAWNYARGRCALDSAGVAALVGRAEETVKKYGHRGGSIPPCDAIDALRAHNLASAFETIAERFGAQALTVFLEEA